MRTNEGKGRCAYVEIEGRNKSGGERETERGTWKTQEQRDLFFDR